ncbi:TPA: hypothetical protein RG501_RS10605 [Providencia rettgeri]|uniref:hypothetical protein n=1 Tax=Providencia stuartii TaxID=588 RepID=UPI00280F5440|nr:hypothetical protein [Providencia rettgeri]
MKRITVNIDNKEISDYIELLSKITNKSKSLIINEILDKQILGKATKATKEVLNLNNSVKMKTSSILLKNTSQTPDVYKPLISHKLDISDRFYLPIPDLNFKKDIRLDLMLDMEIINQALIRQLLSIDEYKTFNPNNFYIDKNKDTLCTGIFFINIEKIKILDSLPNKIKMTGQHSPKESIKNIKDISSELELKLTNIIKSSKKSVYFNEDITFDNLINIEEMKQIKNEVNANQLKLRELYLISPIMAQIEYRGWFLPIYLIDDLNQDIRRYDFLNVKYQSYNEIKENAFLRLKGSFCLLKGRYGFFHCQAFDKPRDISYFCQKYDQLREKKTKRTSVNQGAVINIIQEYISINNHSLILKSIMKVLRQYNHLSKIKFK